MIPVRGYKDHKVAVLGLGRTGLSTLRALEAGGADTIAWDDMESVREQAAQEGFEIADLTRDKPWSDVKALIVSPGIPHLYPEPHPAVAKAQEMGVVIDNDIGLFFRSFATEDWDQFDVIPRVVCVTGSNGKSTTTALIHHVLTAFGKPCQMGGNIGVPVLDLEPAHDGDVVVLELSSYQTELARALAPEISVFLNLSPDHLDRHGGLGGYFAAKLRLFALGGAEKSVIGVDEKEGRYLAAQMREEADTGDPVLRISTTQRLKDGWSIFARKGFLAEWRRERQVASIDLREMPALPGAHNHQNACAAYAVARILGMGAKDIEAAFKTYPGLPHRCQIVANIKGVTFVNDSKATNADAAEKSLLAFNNIHWIAGGVPKEGGIAPLTGLFDRVKRAYLIGEAAPDFAATLKDHPHEMSGTLEAALTSALVEAEEGDVILLAPACASFDQFKSFEARGDAFVKMVEALE